MRSIRLCCTNYENSTGPSAGHLEEEMKRHIIVQEHRFGGWWDTAIIWATAAGLGYFTGDLFRAYILRVFGG